MKAHKINDRVTPEAVEAFRDKDWMRLQRALQLAPWQVNPLDATCPEHPHSSEPHHVADWQLARELRRQLRAAVKTTKAKVG